MKAALFRSPGDIAIVDKRIPSLGDNQVLLKIDYASICGTDKAIFDGNIPCKPVVLGHEFSGEVVKVGSKVKNIEVGSYCNVQPNIACGICDICRKGNPNLCEYKVSHGIHIDGGFAEYCVVNQDLLFPIYGIPHIESPLIEPVACCLHGLKRCNPSIGEDALVIGGGFIGLVFLQLMKLRGLNVHLIEPNKKKRSLAKSLGAECVFESISEVCDDFDIVVEAVGKIETVRNAFRVVGRGGIVLLFGVCPQSETLSFSPYEVWKKELRIVSSRSNGHNHFDAIRILSKLNLKDMITHVIELKDIKRGFKLMDDNNHIKIVIHVSEAE